MKKNATKTIIAALLLLLLVLLVTSGNERVSIEEDEKVLFSNGRDSITIRPVDMQLIAVYDPKAAELESEKLRSLEVSQLTPDQQREYMDALYFNGVPSYMREDWSVTRANDTVFPHALYGSNINNDPEGCCKFVVGANNTDYSKIRPHIFSKSSWANWYKAIDLSKVPTKMKGPSRPQTFDGRKGYVDIAESKEGANGHGWDFDVDGAPPKKVAESSKRIVTVQHSFDGAHGPPTVNPDPNEPRHQYFQEVVKMAAAFAIYDSNPRSESVIPAYCLVCVGAADCSYISHHIDRVYEFGVGYFIWYINTLDPTYYVLPELLAKAFPNRFIVMGARYNRRILSAAGTWNAFINFLFYNTTSPVAWFLNANGDFFARQNDLQDYLAFAQNKMRSNPSHTIIKFQHYSLYMYTYRAYMVLGAFDESVYPAYGEDVEMVYRARSMGLIFDDYKASSSQYEHIGSASLGDPKTHNMMCKWSRDNYINQKWNINMFADGKPFWEDVNFSAIHKHPWGISSIPHRSSYAVDMRHEHCIRTGKGVRIPGDPDNGCFWHGEGVLNLMLPPEVLLQHTLAKGDPVGFRSPPRRIPKAPVYSKQALALLPAGFTKVKRWNKFDGKYRNPPLPAKSRNLKRWQFIAGL